MKYKIIKGTFHVVGYSPDGDSIRFRAENPLNWDFFKWKKAANKKSERKQLRFEAIDALETHYEESHQPRSFGLGAMEILLKLLGITDVVYNLRLTQIYAATDGSSGYIASQSTDMYDRPISLVFGPDAKLPDGAEVDLAELPLEKCVNLKMIKKGLAYPTFYSSMEEELLAAFTKSAKACRRNQTGLWALDRTDDFTIWNITTISDDVVILPKLFRRLTTFINEHSDFEQLPAYLRAKKDRVLIRETGKKTDLVELLEINGRNIKFHAKPEDLIFDPKG